VYGQQGFGTLQPVHGCPDSWWKLDVVAGDSLTVDWESQATGLPYAALYLVGTNDYDFPQTQDLVNSFLNGNDKAQLTYTAPVSGALLLDFSADDICNTGDVGGGPYDFTAYVVHALALSLSGVTPGALTGTASVGVHSPDGTPLSDPAINVQLRASVSSRTPVTLGTAAPSNGVATIAYKLPSSWTGKTVTGTASASGTGYKSATSTSAKVKLASPPCVVPKLTGLTLTASKAKLQAANCALGRVHTRFAGRASRGRVISQSLKPGQRLRNGSRVSVTVGHR
jgi:hypothetical protein